MSVKSGQAITVLFATANATTGAAADATGTPAGTLYVNGTANGATVTVTNITTGVYKAALTLPALSAGDVVSLRIAATVATVAGEGIVWQEVADTSLASDVYARLGAPAGASVSADIAAVKAQIGTGLSAQEVRDALKLAPTAGAPAAGSVDAHLDTLITDVGAIDPSVQLSAAVASAVNSGDLAISTHHALAQTITSTSANDLSARVLVLAVKQYDTDADSAAILLISTDTGLEYVAGAAYATPAHGSLTVSGSAGAWEIAAALDGTATALLTPYAVHSYPAELKDLTSDTAVWTGLALIGRGLVQMLS